MIFSANQLAGTTY